MKIRGLLLLWVLLLTAGYTRGADEVSLDGRDYADRVLDYIHRSTSDAYLKAGDRNEKWDAQVLEAMAIMERRQANRLLNWNWYAVESAKQLLQRYDDIISQGCRDPLVWFHREQVVDALNDPQRRGDYFDVIEPLANSDYPAVIRLQALAIMADNHTRPFAYEDELAWRKDFATVAAEAILALPADVDRRAFYLQFRHVISSALNTDELGKRLLTMLAENNADDWLQSLLLADFYVKSAWRVRGSGWGADVPQDAWPIFHKKIEQARASLVTALRLEPNYPEPAADMIVIVMANGDDGTGDEMHWLKEARRRQVDYLPAYVQARHALQSRWGGGPLHLMALAKLCMTEPRFDTGVPWQFIDIMRLADEEAGPQVNMLAMAGVYDLYVQMAEGYAAAEQSAVDPDNVRARLIAAAWKAGRISDTMDVASKVETLREDILSQEGVPVPRLKALLTAEGGQRRKLLAIERARAAGVPERAPVEEVETLPEDDPQRGAAVEIKRLLDAKQGPTQLFPSNEWGLQRLEGDWQRRDDGSLMARGKGTHQMLATGDLPENVHLTATLSSNDRTGTLDNFGIVFRATNPEDGYLLHIQPQFGLVRLTNSEGGGAHAFVEPAEHMQVDLRLVGGRAEIKVNGKEIFPDQMNALRTPTQSTFGIMVTLPQDASEAVIEGLTIQAID